VSYRTWATLTWWVGVAQSAGHSESLKFCPSPAARRRTAASPLVGRGKEGTGILRYSSFRSRMTQRVSGWRLWLRPEPSPTGRDAASRLCREGHPHLLLRRGLSRNEAGERGKKSRGTLHPNSDEVNRGRCRAVRSWENQFCAVVTARESWHKRG
jgi:hypothetical protein